MHEVKIFFPGTTTSNGSTSIRTEKMLMRSLTREDIMSALRKRGTLHSIDSQVDVEEESDSSGGFLSLSDVLTGEHIVSVMW